MNYLPLDKFSELATQPIFSHTEWVEIPTSYVAFLRPSVTTDLFCEKCEKEKTFSGKAYSRVDLGIKYQQENVEFNRSSYMPFFNDDSEEETVAEMIDERILFAGDSITVQLKCPTCGSLVYICYALEFNKEQDRKQNVFYESDKEPSKYRVHKIGEYPSQETSRLYFLSRYKTRFPKEYQLLVQAERAYRDSLGAGAIVYIRKAYETLLFEILDSKSISRPKNFRELLKRADEAAHIVPVALSDKAYGLFGEISDIVHGDSDDSWGLEKFEDLRDVFVMILSGILEKEHQEELASRIRSDVEASSREKK